MSAFQNDDLANHLMLDGNAIAGELESIFGRDMTGDRAQCASCGQTHAIGALLVFIGGPGKVLRCPSCTAVVLRMARTPKGGYGDLRGSAVTHLLASTD